MSEPDERPVAVVTGGSNGIGRAVAVALATTGHRVAIVDVDHTAGENTARTCGTGHLFLCVDVADVAALTAAFATVCADLGPPRVLVNNAAIASSSLLADSDPAHWNDLFAVNFFAAVHATRLALPGMRQVGSGCVINIASLHARRSHPGWAAYASAKGALMAFSRQQAVEQAEHGIRVNVVIPGATMTGMNRDRLTAASDPARLSATMAASSPLNRYGEPDEIAAVVAFLASDAAGFVTGAEWACDGGADAYAR